MRSRPGTRCSRTLLKPWNLFILAVDIALIVGIAFMDRPSETTVGLSGDERSQVTSRTNAPIAPRTSAPCPMNGTQNMADRLAALGGALEIRSSPGSGTTVRGRVPLVE